MIIIYDYRAIIDVATDAFAIYWEAKKTVPAQESVSDFNFYVQWSESPTDGFTNVRTVSGSDIVIDGAVGPLYVLHPRPHYTHSREYYYRIVAILKSNPAQIQITKVFFTGDEVDGVIDSIQFAERSLYRFYTGEPVRLLKRRQDEERCPECWNPLSFRRTKTHCKTCLGTGFSNGYYAAIPIQIAFEMNPKISEVSTTYEITTSKLKARMADFPLVTPRDMIVAMDDNQRFQVVHVEYTKLPNFACGFGQTSGNQHIISQILTLSEIIPSDDKFSYPVFGKYLNAFNTQFQVPAIACSGIGTAPVHALGYGFIGIPATVSIGGDA